MELHEKIKLYRQEAKMSRRILALMLGTDSRTIEKYEKGDIVPDFEILRRIAALLNISIFTFLPISDSELMDELERREVFINEFYGG